MAPRSQSHQGGTKASACRSTVEWIAWVTARAVPRDARLAGRLAAVVRGILWASGRRTAASRWRAAGVGEHLRPSSYFLDAVGRKVPPLAAALVRIVLDRVDPGGRLLSARDDTPTQRSGPKVPGAGVHHNPTPGPAGAKSLSGPSWVVLNRVVRHTVFGVIGLPLLGLLDVQKDVPMSPATARVAFQTELAIGAAMGRGLKTPLPPPAQRPGLVVDGGYTKRELLKPALQAGYVLVARLRRDAALYDLPPGIEPGQERPRGRPPVYGKDRRSLVKRAGRARGWQTATLSTLTGAVVTKPVKTSLATWRPAGGAVQGVIT